MKKIFTRVMVVLVIILLLDAALSVGALANIKGDAGSDASEIHSYILRNYEVIPDKVEYWQSPFFTIIRRGGDCEDLSILEWSLFKLSGLDASLVFGTQCERGHVWVEYQGYIWDIALWVVEDKQRWGELLRYQSRFVVR